MKTLFKKITKFLSHAWKEFFEIPQVEIPEIKNSYDPKKWKNEILSVLMTEKKLDDAGVSLHQINSNISHLNSENKAYFDKIGSIAKQYKISKN